MQGCLFWKTRKTSSTNACPAYVTLLKFRTIVLNFSKPSNRRFACDLDTCGSFGSALNATATIVF